MGISNPFWSRILGLFRCCGVLKEKSRENPQEENYQPSMLYHGFFVEPIFSAEKLDKKSGPLRILDEAIPEDGKDLETYYLIQRERRSEEGIPKSSFVIKKLWFEYYRIPRAEMIRSSIGWNLLVQCGLQPSPPNSSSYLKTTLSNCPGSAQLHILDSVIMKLT